MGKENIKIIKGSSNKNFNQELEELREDITIRMFYYVYLNSIMSEKGNVNAILERIAKAVHEDLKLLQDLMSNKEKNDKEKQEEYRKRLKRPVSDYIIEIMENMKNQYNEKDFVNDRYLYAQELCNLIEEVGQLNDKLLEKHREDLLSHLKKVLLALQAEHIKAIKILHNNLYNSLYNKKKPPNKSDVNEGNEGKVIPISKKVIPKSTHTEEGQQR